MERLLILVVDRIFIVLSFLTVFFCDLKVKMSYSVLFFIVAQDIFLGIIGIITVIFKKQFILKTSIPGKIATLCQEIFVPLILIMNIFNYRFSLLPFEIAVITTSLISGGHHLYLWITIWKSTTENKKSFDIKGGLSMKHLRGYFFRGLIFTIPAAVTLYVFYTIFTSIDKLLGLKIPGLGFITIALITFIGFLGSNIFTKNYYTLRIRYLVNCQL